MKKLIAFENVSLDGVMQAPARPDEDTRDAFEHGGVIIATYARAGLGPCGTSRAGTLLDAAERARS